MLDGKSDPAPYALAIKDWEAHFLTEGTKKKRGPPKFDYAAQRYEDPCIRGTPFEAKDILHGSLADYLGSCVQGGQFSRGAELYERVGGKADLSDSRIQTDIHLGYWICAHAAKWLKIVATHANWQMSPLEVILQAYTLMPDVVRPQFL